MCQRVFPFGKSIVSMRRILNVNNTRGPRIAGAGRAWALATGNRSRGNPIAFIFVHVEQSGGDDRQGTKMTVLTFS